MNGIYPHANTVAAIEESKLLKQFQYEILYKAKGLPATLNELNGINYFSSYEDAESHNYEQMLEELMRKTFDLMKEISPDVLIWRIFALLYDIHNIKLVVKERFFSTRFSHLALDYGSYSLPTIRSAAVRESDNILENEVLTAGLFNALSLKDAYYIDFELDKTYFTTLRKLVGELDIPGITGFVTERIDLFNASVFLQWLAVGKPEGYFERAFSDQGSVSLEEWQEHIDYDDPREIKKFSLWQRYKPLREAAESDREIFYGFDVLADNYLINKTKAAKLMAFGIEPICAYFYNKFMEIKNIRILLTGKRNNYSTGDIVKRMRIPYEL